jgi:cellulose synthase/poly-beta-1,6-N-acetylglucosamine synthase-like glycosyltransferase
MTVSYVVFWTVLLLLGYVYVGYPLTVWLRARLAPRPHRRAGIEPMVSVLVVAHDEEEKIAARIENLLALDYPTDRLEIVVASDGSTDDTAERARRYQPRGVIVRRFARRRGKAAVINTVVPTLRGDIVLFADARQRFERSTLRVLVENFADPAVGAVSGELMLLGGGVTGAAAEGTSFYWRYEKLIRSSEGATDSTIGATGAIYAIRQRLFEPFPEDTLLDDVLIPLRIIRRGFRVVFEPGARAYDSASKTAGQEFARKARTIAGTFQLFSREPWLLDPRRNRLWFETISHKGLRLMLPLLHLALLAATLALPDGWLFNLAISTQLGFYIAAAAGSALVDQGNKPAVSVSVPCAICLLSWATLVGFVRFLTRSQRVTWDRVPTRAHPA